MVTDIDSKNNQTPSPLTSQITAVAASPRPIPEAKHQVAEDQHGQRVGEEVGEAQVQERRQRDAQQTVLDAGADALAVQGVSGQDGVDPLEHPQQQGENADPRRCTHPVRGPVASRGGVRQGATHASRNLGSDHTRAARVPSLPIAAHRCRGPYPSARRIHDACTSYRRVRATAVSFGARPAVSATTCATG